MKRVHLFEFHELKCFPGIWRDLFTDALSWFTSSKKIYIPVADLLTPLAGKSKNFTVLDICSGAGTPVLAVADAISKKTGKRIQVILTDKYPNIPAFTRLVKESNGTVKFIDKSISAANVPKDLQGFRTFFSSFHHFKEESALAILSDAVNSNQGIGIFEFTEKSLLFRLIPLFIPLQFCLLLNTLSFRPFRWRRILWTYLIPVVPFTFLWDGIVSCFRSYSERELYKLIKGFDNCRYSWEIGCVKSVWPFRITYLIGHPSY